MAETYRIAGGIFNYLPPLDIPEPTIADTEPVIQPQIFSSEDLNLLLYTQNPLSAHEALSYLSSFVQEDLDSSPMRRVLNESDANGNNLQSLEIASWERSPEGSVTHFSIQKTECKRREGEIVLTREESVVRETSAEGHTSVTFKSQYSYWAAGEVYETTTEKSQKIYNSDRELIREVYDETPTIVLEATSKDFLLTATAICVIAASILTCLFFG